MSDVFHPGMLILMLVVVLFAALSALRSSRRSRADIINAARRRDNND